MRLGALILLCAILGGLLVGSVLRRLGVAWGALVSFFAGLLAKVAAGVAFALTAVAAAERGGVWYGALAAALGLLAVGGLALAGLLAWGVWKYGIDGEE